MKQRFYALDVFRGATVALMILVNNPGSWAHIYSPLEHAAWHGLTPTDLVFPFFLFAVGNALAFVMPRLEEAGANAFLKKVITRTILIFAIGLFLNYFPFVAWTDNGLVAKSLSKLRIFGVLQRIALCYGFAATIIYFFKTKGAFVIAMCLLLIYWALCLLLGAPGDPLSLQGFWGTGVDKAILGESHMYHGEGVAFDPEGIVSTLPAIAQVIFGFLVGQYIIQRTKAATPQALSETLVHLFVAACALIFAGFCWDMVFPINKKIWTSSFVVYTSGLAMMILGVMIYFLQVHNYKGWLTRFFDVFGKNPLFIFVLSGLFPRLLGLIRWSNGTDDNGHPKWMSPLGWFYQNICAPISDNPNNGSLLYALITITFYWSIAYMLDRKKIYIKV
jgi:predicted acyltransferase